MGGKQERQRMINGGSVPWHSLNQTVLKTIRDREKKGGFDSIHRAVKAVSRRERIERSQREFEEKQALEEDQRGGLEFLVERCQFQLARTLKHVFVKKSATLQEMDYITQKGKVVERLTLLEGIEDPEVIEDLPEVIITIVDFTSVNSKKLS